MRGMFFYKKMCKSLFLLALAATLAPWSAAQAQSRLTSNSAGAAKASNQINLPIINIPPPTGDAFANSELKKVAEAQPPIIVTPSIGSGTLDSSNSLFTTPSPGVSGAF